MSFDRSLFNSFLDLEAVLVNILNKMKSHVTCIFCLIFIVLAVFVGSSVGSAIPQESHYPRIRKIAYAPWLSAPHLPVFSKRGRFVFRDLSSENRDDSIDPESQLEDFHLDKRNWRL
jgi:hypothetical protein